ncbi:MAG TPA: phosphoadenylyl-sulfate reductase [Thermomicrobiaceae bacterium]|nr:phosphoadenylyl-sulfate reductase [Thermomicrobiaceae bacterium]
MHKYQESEVEPHRIGAIASRLEEAPPEEILRWAIGQFGQRLVITTSLQVEGMTILDMAWRLDPAIRVVTIDTGRLHHESHELMQLVRDRYQIPIEIYYPDAAELEAFVLSEGINSFYRDVSLRLRCCEIRKVKPLERALTAAAAWVTGQRRGQSPTRSQIRKVEIDRAHGGILKLNPLADWTAAQVWEYVREHDVPYNPLYERGFTSIGCEPCTRPTGAGEDPRAGRWWWETDVPKECGINFLPGGSGVVRKSAVTRHKHDAPGS